MSDSTRMKIARSRWAKDFPVRTGEDQYTTRREFTKFLGLASIGCFLGTCWAAGRKFLGAKAISTGQLVARTDELPVSGFKLFRYPESEQGQPCILIRLEYEKYVALTQSCTHLACPVRFDAARKHLACPCHDAFFSAEDGKVLAGPPRRPLTRFSVEAKDGQLWVKPMPLTEGENA